MLSQIPYEKVVPDLPKMHKAQPRPTDAQERLGADHVISICY